MTEQLAKLLAETDDPQAIKELLEYANNDQPTPHSAKDEATLQELYERFLSRRQDRSPTTYSQYKRTIPTFITFAEANGSDSPRDLTTGLVDEYVDRLQATHEADATVLTYTKNVRSWLHWLSKRGRCRESIYRILDQDELGLSPTARDEALPADEATIILSRLQQQRRGSLMHALIELLWNAGPRIGGIHSLDRQDFDPASNEIRLRNRPERGTRLKNGDTDDGTAGDGERNIILDDRTVTALQLYLQYERPDVTDEFDREPLFATQFGRASRSTLRRKIYEATSCRWVPNSNSTNSCDGNCNPDSNVCPSSYYPHAIRRGAIVNHLSGGLPPHIASERFDVSVPTIKRHYDPRSKRRRRKDRADSVRDAW